MALTLQQQHQIYQMIKDLATSEPDIAIRQRAREIVMLTEYAERDTFVIQLAQIARDPGSTAQRLRALDVLEKLFNR